MKKIMAVALAGAAIIVSAAGKSTPIQPLSRWSFDEGVMEGVSGTYWLRPGVIGNALKFDGHTTAVIREAERAPRISGDFSVQAWVALGAYPWNWSPILCQENAAGRNSPADKICWPDDISPEGENAGFYFGISPRGEAGLMLNVDGIWTVCRSEARIPLRRWTHVAAVFRSDQGISLFIDGEKAGERAAPGEFRAAPSRDMILGRNNEPREPAYPVRPFATLACEYSLDGLLDEVRLFGDALSDERIAGDFSSVPPDHEPDLPPRRLPSGPSGPGRFGASYHHLQYYPGWDAQWRVGDYPDIVVRFDDSPVRVVFWRGTRYSPAWVTENGLWMADQSIENFNDRDGCIEHMLDPRCRFSHVRIIESTPARVVVHWRYCPTSANGNHSQIDPVSGWEDWVDETYTFYPDMTGMRKVELHTRGRFLWPEEVIALCHPGQKPEDIIDLDAMTLVNLQGKSVTYSWAERSPRVLDGDEYIDFGNGPGERPVIIQVNLHSRLKPFQIFEEKCRFKIFGHEHRRNVSRFPWWNHWPVAQIPSDGRYCQAADRASHFSLAWGGPPPHEAEGGGFWWAWMYGMTEGPAEELARTAKAWIHPPKLTAGGEGFESRGFDTTRKCYRIEKSGSGAPAPLELSLQGSPETPIHNPAFEIRNWGFEDALVKVEEESGERGKDIRIGYVPGEGSRHLVIWLGMESDSPVSIRIEPGSRGQRGAGMEGHDMERKGK